MPVQSLIPTLGLLGFIPFAVTTGLALSDRLLFGQDPRMVFITYSVVILSFLGGVLWGRTLQRPDDRLGRGLLIASNAVALMAWGGLLAGSAYFPAALCLLMAAYGTVWFLEQRFDAALTHQAGKVYLKLRTALTGMVLSAHLLLLLFARAVG